MVLDDWCLASGVDMVSDDAALLLRRSPDSCDAVYRFFAR